MAEERRSPPARAQGAAVTTSVVLSPDILQNALTPRRLFTNLFPITFSAANLGNMRNTTKAKKEEFHDRRRPRFYQSGEVLYAYGSGLEEFKDTRFTPAIVAIEQEPRFAQHLLKFGLVDFFRASGYLGQPPKFYPVSNGRTADEAIDRAIDRHQRKHGTRLPTAQQNAAPPKSESGVRRLIVRGWVT